MTSPKNTRLPTSHIAPFGVRMQPELKARIEAAAETAGRSLNAEIVARLQNSLNAPSVRLIHERRKLELVAEYVEWCAREDVAPEKSFMAFAKAYAAAVTAAPGEPTSVDAVSSIYEVDVHYLSELYANWILERPRRFPALSDMHPPLVHDISDRPRKIDQPVAALLAFLCRRLLEADAENRAGIDDHEKRAAYDFLSGQIHGFTGFADATKLIPIVDKIIRGMHDEKD